MIRSLKMTTGIMGGMLLFLSTAFGGAGGVPVATLALLMICAGGLFCCVAAAIYLR